MSKVVRLLGGPKQQEGNGEKDESNDITEGDLNYFQDLDLAVLG